jgi:hypothetical protein
MQCDETGVLGQEGLVEEHKKRRTSDSFFALFSHYTIFGQLSVIITSNWDLFGTIFTSRRAVEKVMASLNMLRGPIAHCCPLADDEVDRLRLAVKDWFRIIGLYFLVPRLGRPNRNRKLPCIRLTRSGLLFERPYGLTGAERIQFTSEDSRADVRARTNGISELTQVMGQRGNTL